MSSLFRGRYSVRLAETGEDVVRAQTLRWRAFRAGAGAGAGAGRDADRFDTACGHFLVEDQGSGALVACWRFMPLADGAAALTTYTAQFYDLTPLATYPGRMVEMGRFCIDPDLRDPDILRVAWGAMTAYVDAERIGFLFGCSSFAQTSPEPHLDAFAFLNERHIGPARWLPREKAPEVIRFAAGPGRSTSDAALRTMPPLLRTYLAMGGWVSDHAVIDRDLGTLHVFTGVEVANVPPARARALRAVVPNLSWVKAGPETSS